MTRTGPRRRAREVASDVAAEHGDRAGERVRDALLEDEMWCWLVEAADRAGDYGHQRWGELKNAGADTLRQEDELKSTLSSAELKLTDAREAREEQLLVDVVDDVADPGEEGADDE